MPVLHLGRNVDDVAGLKRPGGLPFLLVPTAAGGDEKNLTALVVNVPVVAAAGFKSDVSDDEPLFGEELEPALSNKELRVGRVRISRREKTQAFGRDSC